MPLTIKRTNPTSIADNNFQFARRTSTAVGKSVLFNGSNQYLTAGAASNWTFLHNGSSWTAECWFNVPSASLSNQYTLISTAAATTNIGIGIYLNNYSAGDVNIQIDKGVSGQFALNVIGNSSSFTPNTWNHVAAVYNSGTSTGTIYINGVAKGSAAGSGFNTGTPTYTLAIGRYQFSTPAGYLDGYISNLRITNSALYTSSFTPPTSPLTAIANTSLLTCNAATIIDGSTNNFAITNNNSATVSSVSPFVASSGGMSLKKVYSDPIVNIITNGLVLNLDASNVSSYPGTGTTWTDLSGNGNNGTLTNGPTFNSANGGSIVFDGNNDSVVTNTGVDDTLSTCTFSAWIKRTNLTNRVGIFNNYANFSGFGLDSSYASAGDISFTYTHINGANYIGRQTNTNAILANNWYHVVGTWDGTFTASGLKIYVNGVRSDTTSFSSGPVTAYAQSEYAIRIGSSWWSNAERAFFNGNIAQALIYNRALTESEVLQNYNATKARFGL